MVPSSKPARHRSLLVLAGEQTWCCQQALEQLALQESLRQESLRQESLRQESLRQESLRQESLRQELLWLGTSQYAPAQALPFNKAQQYLGRELDAVVFDAHAGFDPDAFGAIAGTLRSGGVLLLLTPPLANWPHYPDPINHRLSVHSMAPSSVTGRYLERLVKCIQNSPDLFLLEQGHPLLHKSLQKAVTRLTQSKYCIAPAIETTSDQSKAITAIQRVVQGHRNRPLLLQADRGRGKSAALGIAAAYLLRQGSYTILLTAPRKSAIATVFQHAQGLLPTAQMQPSQLSIGNAVLRFMAPDELVASKPTADLVLVDEAAGIHLTLLEQLLRRYRRVVFSSTVHGYEGAGRGFALRFRKLLNQYAPAWCALELQHPIRWDENDPLERFSLQALLLDAEPSQFPNTSALNADLGSVEQLQRDELVRNEPLLRSVFSLLVQAHYQTRPLDLRHLLDGPNLSIYLLRVHAQAIAVALLADEGCFEEPLDQAIATGQRRPQGHQLAQILAYHYHCLSAARLRYARIVRIAVHPQWQGQGYGTRLLCGLIEMAQQKDFDCIGTVFAASPELITFWRRQHLQPVQIGLSRNAASGMHSVTLLRALSPAGIALQTQLTTSFQRRLPHMLADPLRSLNTHTTAILLQKKHCQALTLSTADRMQLLAFAENQRSYELVIDSLNEFTLAALTCPIYASKLNTSQCCALIAKLIQKRSWRECAELLNVAGRKQVETVLRSAVHLLLNEFSK